ncbi:ATPase [Halobacillus andaensis]|uniref:ATPase n=1 Tax=Halobacillus andaensis TaxID=1176239 RepID=A0A917B839_HALAA|nr:BadF/BadG/BcrA/BcrD ATPase family protein [Halobacillus andaensis]MBP2005359.1 N-acetylglucosamine kinase-like BadF-type ATPase [Halobacillus andaensis]GGF30872.1 ATPase [Halobacillus andaensis]
MIIGIDAGGTSTKGALISKEKEVVATFQSGYGNPLINEGQAIVHINEVIKACWEASDQNIEHVVIGIAGYSTLKGQLTIPEEWKGIKNLTLVNDAELALEAGIPEGDGILSIAGTGSIHIGKKKGKIYTVGGWGHLLGDEGGGYDLGRMTIRKVLESLESSHPVPHFTHSILQQIDCSNATEVKAWFYSQEKNQVANLAKSVSKLAEDEDPVAIHLIKSSSEALVRQIERLYQWMDLGPEAKLVTAGSILLTNNYCFPFIKKHLSVPFKEINKLTEPAYMGAYSIAHKK